MGRGEASSLVLDELERLRAAVERLADSLRASRGPSEGANGRDWAAILQAAAVLVLIATAVVSLRENRRLKTQDVVLEFHRRFADLMLKRSEVDSKKKARAYYAQFWFLNHQEFTLWRQGFIPDDTYRFWLESRQRDWSEASSVGGVAFEAGWNASKTDYPQTDFAQMMSEVLDAQPVDLPGIMGRYTPRWRLAVRRIKRSLSRPFSFLTRTPHT